MSKKSEEVKKIDFDKILLKWLNKYEEMSTPSSKSRKDDGTWSYIDVSFSLSAISFDEFVKGELERRKKKCL